MLTVLIRHKNKVVYLKPFENHDEAIKHFCEMYNCIYGNTVLALTNLDEIEMGEPEIPFYSV